MPESVFTTVRILGQRPASRPAPHPEPIPAEAEIYYGPALLLGTIVDGLGLTWVGAPIAGGGAYFAAILPPTIRLEFVTLDQVLEALRRFYAGVLHMNSSEIEIMMGKADEKEA